MLRNLNKQRTVLLLVSLSLALLAGVGVTLALIIDSADPVDNTFEPSRVACEVVEDSFTGAVKSGVKIKNTGDTDAYIRAAVVVTWKNGDGKVWAVNPELNTDYSMSISEDGWKKIDGYYYYKESVSPSDGENLTKVLITEAKQLKAGPVGTDGTQYYLSIEIVASAIQSSPDDAVNSAWGVTAAQIQQD